MLFSTTVWTDLFNVYMLENDIQYFWAAQCRRRLRTLYDILILANVLHVNAVRGRKYISFRLLRFIEQGWGAARHSQPVAG
jgi:hypothetical protein